MRVHSFIVVLFIGFVAMGVVGSLLLGLPLLALVGVGLGVAFLFILRIASQWERAVVLRLGRYKELKGPGIFGIIPFIDTIPYCIDLRTIATPFTAEQTLTKDSVPVDVDAVLFWRVVDPVKAALEVENYGKSVAWASQTALRDVIGETVLADMLIGRQQIDARLCKMIESRTEVWGIRVLSVELRDVKIPTGLQDAMSKQAQAERERQARVILSESERQIADNFLEASQKYAGNPTAMHLRGMNILLEGMKNNASLIIVPSSAVETMGLGSMAGLSSLAKEPPSK